MKKLSYRTPTSEELYAIEQQARRLRAAEFARLGAAAARACKSLAARARAALAAKPVRHA